jgi:hypothetical protein
MSHHPAEPNAANPGYETRDVNIRAVLWLGIGVGGGTILVGALLWLLLAGFVHRAERRERPLSPLAAERKGPPAPHLQDAPLVDYREFRAREDHLLSTYGWADKEKGTVRIPIERAMELLVERGETAVSGTSNSEEVKGR